MAGRLRAGNACQPLRDLIVLAESDITAKIKVIYRWRTDSSGRMKAAGNTIKREPCNRDIHRNGLTKESLGMYCSATHGSKLVCIWKGFPHFFAFYFYFFFLIFPSYCYARIMYLR